MLSGMIVSGFIVRFVNPFDGEPLNYGLFATKESALHWASFATSEVVVEPVYAPTMNRG